MSATGITRLAPASIARRSTRTTGRTKFGLERTEALLRSTLDALSAHIAVLDEAGTIIAVNQAAVEQYGYTRQGHRLVITGICSACRERAG